MLYESTIHPLTIISTLPSAGLGALLTLMLFGMPLDVIGIIGIILLIGIVKKNGIMLVDFALVSQRERGLTSEDAIHEACVLVDTQFADDYVGDRFQFASFECVRQKQVH